MVLRYKDIFEGGKPHRIKASITTEHPTSSYGVPVVVLPDGGALNAESWVLMGYEIVSLTKREAPLMKRWLKNLDAMIGTEGECYAEKN